MDWRQERAFGIFALSGTEERGPDFPHRLDAGASVSWEFDVDQVWTRRDQSVEGVEAFEFLFARIKAGEINVVAALGNGALLEMPLVGPSDRPQGDS